MLDTLLRRVLACPEDKGPLLYFADEASLYNPRLRLRYRVRQGIPVLLRGEAEALDDREHERLVRKAERDEVVVTGSGSDRDPG